MLIDWLVSLLRVLERKQWERDSRAAMRRRVASNGSH